MSGYLTALGPKRLAISCVAMLGRNLLLLASEKANRSAWYELFWGLDKGDVSSRN